MSADNGTYVLETKKGNWFEYRVKEMSAVENVYWKITPTKKNPYAGKETSDQNVWIKNARKMWKDCKVFSNRIDALIEADRVAKQAIEDYGILEYGICFIRIDKEF